MPCNLYGKYDKFDDNSSHMIPAVIKKKIHHAKINNVPEIEIWGGMVIRAVNLCMQKI
ncbi:NAD-dependent epimerase/dehydratase family protein [Escherichia coli]|nr:NAD-dependent epimerase/dehydratase family protein [Escherichia coli]